MRKYRRVLSGDVTPEWLEDKRAYAAWLIQHFGEQYLPIFERLHDECQAKSKRNASLDLVRHFASKAA